jgi:hypothetical protein
VLRWRGRRCPCTACMHGRTRGKREYNSRHPPTPPHPTTDYWPDSAVEQGRSKQATAASTNPSTPPQTRRTPTPPEEALVCEGCAHQRQLCPLPNVRDDTLQRLPQALRPLLLQREQPAGKQQSDIGMSQALRPLFLQPEQSPQEAGTEKSYTIKATQCWKGVGSRAGRGAAKRQEQKQEQQQTRHGSHGTHLEGCVLWGAALHSLPQLKWLVAGCRAAPRAGVGK